MQQYASPYISRHFPIVLPSLPLPPSPSPFSLVSTFVDEVVAVPSLTTHTANLIIPLLKKALHPSVVMAALVHKSHDGHMTLAIPASFELLHFVLNITAGELRECTAPYAQHHPSRLQNI